MAKGAEVDLETQNKLALIVTVRKRTVWPAALLRVLVCRFVQNTRAPHPSLRSIVSLIVRVSEQHQVDSGITTPLRV